MERQYRMLRGRGGASGYARGDGNQGAAEARGLPPGGEAMLYRMDAGRVVLCDRGKTDGRGNIRFRYMGEGALFITDGSNILLWEDGPTEGHLRLRAAEWLRRGSEKATKREEPVKITPATEVSAEESATEETMADEKEDTQAQEMPEEPLPQADEPQEEPEDAGWHLRAETDTEAVDALPVLDWSESAAGLKPYFDECPPIAPFDAPGWRFVRAPSPLRGVPYCAVGYLARDNRVVQVAYAVPGSPYQAPAPLPGYRYQPGRDGKGYWTLWQRVR